MNELYDLVKKAKSKDNNSIMEIITRFKPLIRKYSKKLTYEDAETDLIICLIECIIRMPIYLNFNLQKDECIVGYINTCIKHKYIELSKRNGNILKSETVLNTDILGEDRNEDIEDKIVITKLIEKLPILQKRIIEGIYMENIPEAQLAKQLNISRQAVNKTKNRALNNLRKEYLS